MISSMLLPVKKVLAKLIAPVSRLLEQRLGFHLVRRHYYSPVPDRDDFPSDYWDRVSTMPGVDLNLDSALELLGEVLAPYVDEFRQRYPLEATPEMDFHLINGTYMAVDAHMYWALIRHLKPQRIVEIGAHSSTMISVDAVAENRRETGVKASIRAIEPFPSDYLVARDGNEIELMVAKVQDVPMAVFEALEAGDILFIDSTHMLRQGSDVQHEYLEILPRLASGVYVHVHDVSLPKHYPKVYFDQQLYWNEQYLLQAFLAFNKRFEVVWPGNAMMLTHPDTMLKAFPEIEDMRAKFPSSEPTAFWMRVV